MATLNRHFLIESSWLAALGLGLVMLLDIMPYQLDDAFITWRYAQNYLAGGVYSFNITGSPVEGFSSQAWFWLGVAWGHVFGHGQVHVAGVVAGSLSYIALVLLYRFRGAEGRAAAAVIAGLAAVLAGHVVYAVTGLETVFFVLLVNIVALGLLRKVGYPAACVAGFLAGWVRPEAPWLLVMACIVWMMHPEKRKQAGFYALILAIVAGCVTMLLFRWSVFGEWFPNTYYEKEADWKYGLAYLKNAFLTPWFAALFLAATLSVFSGSQRTARTLYLLGCSWLLAGVLEGGDWMSHFRFFLPGMGLLLLSIQGSLAAEWWQHGHWWRKLSLVLLLLAYAGASLVTIRDEVIKSDNQLVMGNLEYRWLKNWILENRLESVAAVDIGELGYSSPLDIVDLGGLTDAYIAGLPGRHLEKTIPDHYVLGRSPDVVVIRLRRKPGKGGLNTADVMSPVEGNLLSSPAVMGHYVPLFIISPSYERYPFYGLLVLVHQSKAGPGLMQHVEVVVENGLPFAYLNFGNSLYRAR